MRAELPAEPVLYVADSAHLPYGSRSLAEVRRFSEGITRFLLARGAKLIVLACNTASAAALHELRRLFPDVPFVGMEPAVKPAAASTVTGVVGVLATPATFQGALYASVVARFARDKQVIESVCPGLVGRIEQGDLDGPRTRAILETALQPMLAQGMDTVVLGCTHYPWVIPLIREIVGPSVKVIDPAPAVARQVRAVLESRHLRRAEADSGIMSRFVTTGKAAEMARLTACLLRLEARPESAHWAGDRLEIGCRCRQRERARA